MKSPLAILIGVSLAVNSPAATRYVNVNNANPTPPYTNWATAANVIQHAVDASDAGDEIVVTNGIYATGGRRVGTNTLNNCVVVDKPVLVRSVNGPLLTVINGSRSRCAYVTNGAVLSGFTLTNGATLPYPHSYYYDRHGAGVWCESKSALVTNCVLVGNAAGWGGGGAFSGTLNSCTLIGNSAMAGGGAYSSTLNNCFVISNRAELSGGGTWWSTLNNCAVNRNSANEGGGASGGTLNNCTLTFNSADSTGGGIQGGTLNNCVVYFNSASSGANYTWSPTMNYCCTTPNPGGGGNISSDPQLLGGIYLGDGSPCRGAGNGAYATGVDIDDELWENPPSIGCDEYHPGAATGPLTVSFVATFTTVAMDYSVGLTALVDGRASATVWDFGDGSVSSNQPSITHSWVMPGDYTVVFRAYNETHPGGVTTSQIIHVVEGLHYVAASSTNPVSPFTSWATAASRIQDAVNVTVPGATVTVANGVYATGVGSMYGTMLDRVAIGRPITVRSVNGPQSTWIVGQQVPGTTNGNGAIRCVSLTSGATLSGFTLNGGATKLSGDESRERSGGGVWCMAETAVVTNCVIMGNYACSGGGASGGTLIHCTLANNQTFGPGFSLDGGMSCGGGAYGSTLDRCVLTGNSATAGGGAARSALVNCILSGNSASGGVGGGGGWAAGFRNCTVTGNTAAGGGGGASECSLWNSIVYYNSATNWPDAVSCYADNSCATGGLSGTGNITSAPLFVDLAGGNLRLQPNSPCVNTGINSEARGLTDFDGNPRIVGGTVDMGAFEFIPTDIAMFYQWLRQYGLPSDGSAYSTDSDDDGHSNWQEWRADTVPTNALSALRMLSSTGSGPGVIVSWESVNTRSYWLERASSLSTPSVFSIIASNLPGQVGTTGYTDTNTVGAGSFFYRVGVQP